MRNNLRNTFKSQIYFDHIIPKKKEKPNPLPGILLQMPRYKRFESMIEQKKEEPNPL